MSAAAPWVAAVFGLIAGSFISVCVWRLPRGLSVVHPGSRCPVCAHPLPAWENLPLVGMLWLRGRCRACRTPISWRYPALELGCAAAFWWSWRVSGTGGGAGSIDLIHFVQFIQGAFFLACLLALAATDLETRLLPDEITLGGIAAGLVLSVWAGPGWIQALSAGAGGAGLLALAGAGYQHWRGRAGLGWGDVKMVGFLGVFLGVGGLLVAVFLASITGAAVGVAQALAVFATRRRRGMSRAQARRATARYLAHAALPFGVFLAAGGAAAWRWGPWLWRAWLG